MLPRVLASGRPAAMALRAVTCWCRAALPQHLGQTSAETLRAHPAISSNSSVGAASRGEMFKPG